VYPWDSQGSIGKNFYRENALDKRPGQIDELFPKTSIKFREIAEINTHWENFNERTLFGVIKRIQKNVDRINRISSFFSYAILRKILGKNFSKTFPFDRRVPESGKYYVSISRGCVHNCTYCVIRKGVGPLHRKSPEQCVKDISCGLQDEYREFVLEADGIGPYGVNIGCSLPDLLKKIMGIDEHFTLKISHTHPMWIIEYGADLTDILKQKKVNSFFVSIQSGSNRILKLMGRPYPTEQLIDTILKFKKSNPDLEIGVNLIVGFPSETEVEFYDTLNLFKNIHFDYGVIFPFSCHEGTKASAIEPKISEQVMNRGMKAALLFLKKIVILRGVFVRERFPFTRD
jgi:tRNA A37 methylthiotransferase MiaB